MKKTLSAGTLWIALALVVGSLGTTAVVMGEEPAVEVDAKTLFVDTHKCNLCHSVPAADIEAKTKSDKMKGPDLGGKVEASLEEIAAYVRKQAEIDGKAHKKEFKGTDEELQTIIDWLGSLEAQE